MLKRLLVSSFLLCKKEAALKRSIVLLLAILCLLSTSWAQTKINPNQIGPGTISSTITHTGALNSNNLAAGNVANKSASTDAIQFVSTNGNDSNDGLSWGSAKATIAAAKAGLPNGSGKIFLAAGTYTITSNLNLTALQNLTIEGPAYGVNPNSNGVSVLQINFTGSNTVGLDISGSSNITLRNLVINCGTSAANAPTVCLLQARTSGSNTLNDLFDRVIVQSFGPWTYYNYRGENTTWRDSQISTVGTSGTPATLSLVNTAAITSPNVTFGGVASLTGVSFSGAAMNISSSSTAAGSKLLYLDEGSTANPLGNIWWQGFFNLAGSNETAIADTSGATGAINNLAAEILSNSSSSSNALLSISGALNYPRITGTGLGGGSSTLQISLNTTFNGFFDLPTGNSGNNCFSASNAANSILMLDGGCTPTAPNAFMVLASSRTLPSVNSITFSHAGSTTISPQSQSGAFTATLNAVTAPLTNTIASGTATMTTAAIASLACGTTVTVSAPGVLTTDSIAWAFNSAPAANPGELVVSFWPTANNVNFQYCNPTAGSVTPNAATLNWKVPR